MKKNKKTTFLIILVLFIAIGYAYLSASLGIVGQGRFNPAEWGLYFNNSKLIYYDKDKDPYIDDYLQYTINENGVEFEINAELEYPGDYYVINVDIVNAGTIDAVANIISVTGLTEEQEQYADYEIMFADKQPITQGISLKAGETDTISILLKYKEDVTEEIITKENKTATFTIGLEYQAGKGTTREKRKALLKDGPTVNAKIKEVAGPSSAEVSWDDTNVKAIKRSYTIKDENRIDNNLISTTSSEAPIYIWFEDGTIYYYADTYDEIIMNEDSSELFRGFEDCHEIEVETLDSSNVTDMSYIFTNDWKVLELDTSKWNTSNVTNMAHMFESCYELKSLYIPFFYTDNVENMNSMFAMCTSLSTINLGNNPTVFNTENVTNMDNMFFNCFVLTDIPTTQTGIQFNTSNVTSMQGMFEGMLTIEELDIHSFNTSKVTNMSSMFEGCKKLKKIIVSSNFDTSNVTNSTNMFYDCLSIVGKDGTTYDSNHIDVGYAHVDGWNGPGYFTPDVY